MLRMQRISELYDVRVFTDDGEYFGDVEEAVLSRSRVSGWRVKATKNSFLSKFDHRYEFLRVTRYELMGYYGKYIVII